ncbi:MAG: hypothetical protein WCX28_11485 [Bacteriovoracaceae bacterium]|nr:hypothetical protein [Bacteroidota bacterium]
MNTSITTLLYRSFDAALSLEEQSLLNKALISTAELSEEHRQIEKLRTVLQELSVQSFSERFIEELLYRISKNIISKQEYWESLLWAFRRVVVIGSLLLVILSTYNLHVTQSISLDALFHFSFWETADITQIDTFQR